MCTGRMDVGAAPTDDGTRDGRCTRRESRVRVLAGMRRTSLKEGGALSRRRHVEGDTSTITADLCS